MTSTKKHQLLSSAENEGWVDCISGTIITERLVRRIHAVNEMGMESQRLMIEKGHLCQLLYFPAAIGLFPMRYGVFLVLCPLWFHM